MPSCQNSSRNRRGRLGLAMMGVSVRGEGIFIVMERKRLKGENCFPCGTQRF
jgi:hypothetical protein